MLSFTGLVLEMDRPGHWLFALCKSCKPSMMFIGSIQGSVFAGMDPSFES